MKPLLNIQLYQKKFVLQRCFAYKYNIVLCCSRNDEIMNKYFRGDVQEAESTKAEQLNKLRDTLAQTLSGKQ